MKGATMKASFISVLSAATFRAYCCFLASSTGASRKKAALTCTKWAPASEQQSGGLDVRDVLAAVQLQQACCGACALNRASARRWRNAGTAPSISH